jgi:hypothetical protein
MKLRIADCGIKWACSIHPAVRNSVGPVTGERGGRGSTLRRGGVTAGVKGNAPVRHLSPTH